MDRSERDLLRELLAGSTFARLNLPPAIEEGYQAYHHGVALAHLRTYWPIGAISIAVIAAWLFMADLVVPSLRTLVMLGLCGIFALVAAVVLCVHVEALAHHLGRVLGLTATAGLLALHVATLIAPVDTPLQTIAQFGVILVAIAVFTISNLTFRPAVLCVVIATAVFMPLAYFANGSFQWDIFGVYTLGSGLVGATIGFSQEVRERAVYLQGRLLFLEKKALDAMTDTLEHLSRTDALTGLANRRHFDEFLAREWANCVREGSEINLLFIDVDFFKPYNDHYGHRAGDDCLAAVGRALGEQALRGADFIARYGGEEFVAMFPQNDRAGLVAMAERIGRAIDELALPHAASTVASHVTVSIGIASMVPAREDAPSRLIEMADEALYRAKAGGRHRYEVSWA